MAHSHDPHDGHDHAHAHAHAHGHGHAHGVAAAKGRTFAFAIAINAVFVALEWSVGAYANSLALMADAAHNLGDVLSLILAWGAVHLSQRGPSSRYTYGWRASSILAALVNAVILLLVTGALCWEAMHRLRDAQPVEGGWVAATAFAAILVNGGTAWLFASGRESDLNVRAVYLHMAADAAVSLAVVLAGIVVVFTAWYWIDPLLTLVVSLLIIWQATDLLRQSLRLAVQAVPDGIDAADVKHFLAQLPGVADVHDLHIWAMSTTQNALTAHLVMPGRHPGDAFLQDAARELESRFRIEHATLQIEVADTRQACALAPDHVV